VLAEGEQHELLERLDVLEGGDRKLDHVAVPDALRADGGAALVELREQVGGGGKLFGDAVVADAIVGYRVVLDQLPQEVAVRPELLGEFGL